MADEVESEFFLTLLGMLVNLAGAPQNDQIVFTALERFDLCQLFALLCSGFLDHWSAGLEHSWPLRS